MFLPVVDRGDLWAVARVLSSAVGRVLRSNQKLPVAADGLSPDHDGVAETASNISEVPVQWHLVGGAQMYEGRLPNLTARNLRAESPGGALPKEGERLMLPVAGFPEPVPFRCVAVLKNSDPQRGPVMTIELEIG